MSLFQPSPLPLVAILRGLTPAEAPMVGHVLFDTGFRILEVPLNRPGAIEAMRILMQNAPADALIGAGTVLTVQQVDEVKQAGGRLIVSPHCAVDVISHAVKSGMIAMPGVATPTEAFQALNAGAQGLKLFPAEMLPPGALKSILSILPAGTPLFPVGGIHPQNMAPYVAAGAAGFGIGGALYQPNIEEGAFRRSAEAFMSAREKLLQGA
ncbi:2-dehydro-3-deoxy-6-phosphogalactonate aldolase [Noviherbaspirillum galbum]|uniref:2-dehydro-3-deoxy-6-phosphogalactonate aldolase n=1 Tax=Noviherbaspirillum galbum TaxID=2709383 RepID=A0A6B3SGK4_9BURK|nr:2-dehydro-3-deoxy-6-phosphogalactonate aldolase [Noviherbaspirillum galbum]NEX59733.1 2-dehydro-3-deoxy-6-phosphogalactonate aldolase [Noviherbaspirillum galbum]